MEAEKNIEIFTFGRTRSGKSTLCDTLYHYLKNDNLQDINPVSICSIFSDRENPSRRTVLYNSGIISISDTRGLFECVSVGQNEMNNDDILNINNNFFPKKFGWKKIALFTFCLEAGLTPHDVKSLKLYSDIINNDDFKCAIVLTNAERYPSEKKTRLIGELQDALKRYDIDINKFQFLCTGALNENYARFPTSKTMIITNIENMMKDIIKFITE